MSWILGVLLIGILGSLLPEPLQRVNALKNLLSLVVNGVAERQNGQFTGDRNGHVLRR